MIRRQDGEPDEKIELDLPLPGLHLKRGDRHQLPGSVAASLGRAAGRDPARRDRRARPDRRKRAGPDEPARAPFHPSDRARDHRPAQGAGARSDLARGGRRDPLRPEQAAGALPRRHGGVPRAAAWRSCGCGSTTTAAAIAAVVQLLWDTALRIEDGRMSLAERELRKLQQELQDALRQRRARRGDRPADERAAAGDRPLSAGARRERAAPSRTNRRSRSTRRRCSPRRDLQRMLDRARELASSGAQRAGPRAAVAAAEHARKPAHGAARARCVSAAPARREQMMRGLHEMMQRQQQLLDRSFRAQRQRGQGDRPGQHGQPGQNGQPGQPGDEGEWRTGRGDGRWRRPAGGAAPRAGRDDAPDGRRDGRHPRAVRPRRAGDARRRRGFAARPAGRGDRAADRCARPVAAGGARLRQADARENEPRLGQPRRR